MRSEDDQVDHVQANVVQANYYEWVIRDLRKRLIEHPAGTKFFTSTELALTYKVSRTTINKYLKILQKENLVLGGRGSNPHKPHKPTSLAISLVHTDLKENLYKQLSSSIRNGLYRTGETLPKRAFFAQEFKISERAITQVMRRLATDGLLHRQGKQFVVGSSTVFVKTNEPAVILIVMPRIVSWRQLFNERTEQFCWEFQFQIQRHQIQILHIVMKPEQNIDRPITWDEQAIANLISSLGPRYRGTLIIGKRAELPELDTMVIFLRHFKQAVVWFDQNDEYAFAERENIYRCHFCEESAIFTALSYLRRRGHTVCAYPKYDNRDWILEREKLLRSTAQKLKMKLFVPPTLDESIVDISTHNDLKLVEQIKQMYAKSQLITELQKPKNGQFGTANLADLLWNDERIHFALLIRPCLDEKCTAIIAPNDWFGVRYNGLLNRAGIRVPNECSLISFDNRQGLFFRPLTTVDFGFASLAHMTFRLFLKDLPSSKNKSNIPATSMVIERGSVK